MEWTNPSPRRGLRDGRSAPGENDKEMFEAVEPGVDEVTLFTVFGPKPMLDGTRIWTADEAHRTYALVPRPWVGEIAEDEIEGGLDEPGTPFADRVVYYADASAEGYMRASYFAPFIV
jgi:hypothetical protein